MTARHHALALLALVPLASACGGSPAPLASTYSVAQLNAFASQPPPEEGVGRSHGNTGSTSEPPPAPEPPPLPPSALVRVVHASPDPVLATVAAFADHQSDPMIEQLAFRAAWGYHNLGPGEHSLEVRPVPAGPSVASITNARTPALEAGHRYTLVVHGLTSGAPRTAVAVVEDTAPAHEADRAHVRFFHAVVGLGAVDVCLPGESPTARATPLFANVSYGAWGALQGGQDRYGALPSGREVSVQLRARAATACTGRLLGSAPVTAAEDAVVTTVAIGRTTGRPVTRELLTCTDAPLEGDSTCVGVPLVAPAPTAPAPTATRPAQPPAARP